MCTWRIALNLPVYKEFDYLSPIDTAKVVHLFARVVVPFGKKQYIGIVIQKIDASDIATSKLRHIVKVLDSTPLLDNLHYSLLSWVSYYYKYPLGQVLNKFLAVGLRKGVAAQLPFTKYLILTEYGRGCQLSTLSRSPKQTELWQQLQQAVDYKLELSSIKTHLAKALISKDIATIIEQEYFIAKSKDNVHSLDLTQQQQVVIDSLENRLTQFHCNLLEGITGSGKTEVYIRLIAKVISAGKQALILLPEVNLVPQILQRFGHVLGNIVFEYHSKLTDTHNLTAWLLAYSDHPVVIVGTRSAAFLPFKKLGIIIIDEEHDQSFKENKSFYYSAKDVSIKRAKLLNIPIVLGSATPSLESLYNASTGRYAYFQLSKRASGVIAPLVQLIDMHKHPHKKGFTQPVIHAIGEHLARGNQVLVFHNRRGYARVLSCADCEAVVQCPNCDTNLVVHFAKKQLVCHRCDYTLSMYTTCHKCGSNKFKSLGRGTESIEYKLQALFPNFPVFRIDSDTTGNNKGIRQFATTIKQHNACILVGTQMLAKGHHFPLVNLAVILQADMGLYSPDFRSSERLHQLLIQAAGRAGREERGQVILQTNSPDNESLDVLLKKGYRAYAELELLHRKHAGLPPFMHLALINCIAIDKHKLLSIMHKVMSALQSYSMPVKISISDSIQKTAKKHHSWLLLQAKTRGPLHQLLDSFVSQLLHQYQSNTVRVTVDIDPQHIY